MTALSFVETMRAEGHKAIVHTAAASNLGQMLVKICAADGVPLVNIVRRPAHVEQLRALGAEHVLDSSTPTFGATCSRRSPRPVRRSLRRDRWRLARRTDPRRDGARSEPGDDELQPLRLVDAQAALHLRLARPLADAARADVRAVVERRRLPRENALRKLGPEVAARMFRRVASELTRRRLRATTRADLARSAARPRDAACVRADVDRREVPDHRRPLTPDTTCRHRTTAVAAASARVRALVARDGHARARHAGCSSARRRITVVREGEGTHMKSIRKSRTKLDELAPRTLETKQLRAVTGGMCMAFPTEGPDQCKVDYECWNNG